MNKSQKMVLLLGVAVIFLMLLFPPFIIPGRLVDQFTYAPAWRPPLYGYPKPSHPAIKNHYLLYGQIAMALVVTLIATALLGIPKRR